MAVPLYDWNITATANEGMFTSQFDYVAKTASSSRGVIISFSVLAALFFVLAIVALVMTRLTNKDRSESNDELLQENMQSSQD